MQDDVLASHSVRDTITQIGRSVAIGFRGTSTVRRTAREQIIGSARVLRCPARTLLYAICGRAPRSATLARWHPL